MEKVIDRPWPHLIIDDFLPRDVLAQALDEIRSDDYSFDIEDRGEGRIEFSFLKCKELWRAIYSKQTLALLREAFKVEVSLNKQNMLQLRRMNNETPNFSMHHDFVTDQPTIASFLYISSGWSPEKGGCLNLYGSESESESTKSIAPLQNRWVAFRTEASHWHSVDRVHGWERFSILALWNVEASVSP